MKIWKIDFLNYGAAVGINSLFGLIAAFMLTIYFLFEPTLKSTSSGVEAPVFNIEKFVVYELTKDGLKGVLNGSNGVRYKDRYEIDDIGYMDRSKKFIATMSADHGLYKDDVVELNKDVVYTRDDGLICKSEQAKYDKKISTAFVDVKYICRMGKNSVEGSKFEYNNQSKELKAENISAKYQLKESKW